MKNSGILSIIQIANTYHKTPSQYLGLIPYSWEAFCFDEACTYILNTLKNNEDDNIKIHFEDEDTKQVYERQNNKDIVEIMKMNNEIRK